MACEKVCEDMTVLLQNDTLLGNSLWVPTASASFHESMVHFENVGGGDGAQLLQQSVKEETGDDDFEIPRGKKRRLSATQVQLLENSFEVENKLEPEKKIQLANELGLQPRQVAIWFQNRRARSKNKQLEKEYGSLKSSYDKLKLDYDILLKEREYLNNQFVALKEKLNAKEEKTGNLGVEKPAGSDVKMVAVKHEDAVTSSGKSDVLDSDSPNSHLDPVDSCQVLESEFSQEEDDEFRSLLPEQYYTKVYREPPSDFEFTGEDQPFWNWTF